MRSVMRKKMRWAPLMGGATLMCAALMNSAHGDETLEHIGRSYNVSHSTISRLKA
jgi:hypothetical protein